MQAADKNYEQKIEHVRGAVVEVLVSGKRFGTGFCVSTDGYFLTATHVVGAPAIVQNAVVVNYQNDLSVRLADGSTVAVTPVKDNRPDAGFRDITLLKAEAKTPKFLNLGTPNTVKAGEDVYVMGFPLDVPSAVTYRGPVSALFPISIGTLNGRAINSSTIHVQMPIAKGFSGSPLLRISDDTVVGVITNKLGGINPNLNQVRSSIIEGQKQGSVVMLGVDPNKAMLELINVLDAYLSAGAGWAVSIEHAPPLPTKN